MMKSTVLAFLALVTSTWALSIFDNQVKVSQVKGTEIDCNGYGLMRTRFLPCPRNLKQICGTDQNTYDNECLLCSANVEKQLNIRKLHDGPCIQCPKEERHICPMDYTAHCGSDGTVYPNKCFFCNAYVRSRGFLTFKNYGKC
ncbi:double-headed protease inhibitor, submandibular gland-like [Macrotis lagotis]|uniref:double-headed protease inhibitor, submandibular gland-like n=1 Tax=Macrotis lagotis TaxID=92651 RepID=UPI003D685FB3